MKIYTVYIPSGDPKAQEKAVFIREGFSWGAALFMVPVWALYHRLWWILLASILLSGCLVSLLNAGTISQDGLTVLQLGVSLLFGFTGNDWLCEKFAKRGYVLADITAADSLLRAEQRYFERLLRPAH